jgi:hypothetical protein
MSKIQMKPITVFIAVGSLVVVGGAWALLGGSTAEQSPSGLPAELSVASLKKTSKDPSKMRESMRESFRRDDLTDEQRTELRGNMRQVWTSALNERVDEYYNAPEANREAMLDRHIDDMAERRKQWEARRREREAERKDGESGENRQRPRFASASRQERQQRSESRNPDQSARAMVYFNNLRVRAAERGVEMPGRGPGRSGGGRGGRGGGP